MFCLPQIKDGYGYPTRKTDFNQSGWHAHDTLKESLDPWLLYTVCLNLILGHIVAAIVLLSHSSTRQNILAKCHSHSLLRFPPHLVFFSGEMFQSSERKWQCRTKTINDKEFLKVSSGSQSCKKNCKMPIILRDICH